MFVAPPIRIGLYEFDRMVAMNWIVFHIVSGHAFFSGILLLFIAVLVSISKRPFINRFTALAFLFGIIAIVLSSTPLPPWVYLVAAVATLLWIASRYSDPLRRWTPGAMIAVWLMAAGIEIPYHRIQPLALASNRSLAILGDSVSAGIGSSESFETWPSILGREYRIEIQDISHAGETVASALTRARKNSITASVVIVELGGNDVLGATSATQFANDLDAMLEHLTAPDRQIVMFELPLPPFYHAYGRRQRMLAAKYKVNLIPKSVFLSIIAGNGITLDSIHLSQSGHQLMADRVWELIETAYEKEFN